MKKKMMLTLLAATIFSAATASLIARGNSNSDGFKVGLTVGDLSNPFFYTMGRGAEEKIKELAGDSASTTILSSSYDLSKQVSQIDNFIANGTQLIILNAADTAGIAPAVKKIKQAGIAVIAVDVGADGGVDATVTSDNYQAGTITAEFLVERIGGKGNVVIINGPPVTAVIDRVKGAKDVFAKYPDIKILSDNQNAGGSRDGGLRVMSNLLTSFNQIDVVFAINDPSGIGAELAIRQAGREKEMFVVGIDGSPDAVVALKDPDSIFLASAAQDPKYMTEKAVEIGYNLVVNGQKPESGLIEIPVSLVTKDN
ncbi:MAG: ABC transporter substrate-binding protein, partial [Spirochaetota bacterium]